MRKLLSVFLAVLLIVTAIPVGAFVFAEDVYRYGILPDGTIVITKYTGSDADLVIPAQIDGYDVTEIGAVAFSERKTLKSVVIPESVNKISNSAFELCTKLESIVIPNNVETIGEYVFDGDTNLSSVTIGSGVTSIGKYAFKDCSALTEINISEDNKNLISIDGVVYSIDKPEDNTDDDVKLVVYPSAKAGDYKVLDGTKIINPYAFSYCKNITGVEFPDTLAEIGDCAFEYSGIETLEIPGSVTKIGSKVFWYCSKLKSVIIKNGVKGLGSYSFEYCTSLSSIEIPESVTSIKYSDFQYSTKIEEINISPDNKLYTSVDGVVFNKDQTELVIFPSGRTGNYIIPDGITKIGYGAFEYGSIDSVEIPDSVTEIDSFGFYSCKSLTDIYFNGRKKEFLSILVNMRNESFLKATIHLGDGSIYEPDEITSLFKLKFSNGEVTIMGLVDINPYNITQLGIPSEILGDTVTTIGSSAFSNRYLKNVALPSTIKVIKDRAFSSCTQISAITIPNGVTSIGDYAFHYCGKLSSIKLSENLDTLGVAVFQYCDKLTSIEIPDNVTTVGDYAFAYCNGLQSVKLSNKLTTVNPNTFLSCSKLETITIPKDVKKIGNSAFSNCSSLKSIILSNKIINIDSRAFAGCTSLSDIYYDGTEEEWNSITINNGNEPLFNATIHFNGERDNPNPDVDLAVTRVSVSQSTITDGDDVNLYCMIRNNGTEATQKSITIDFYYNGILFDTVCETEIIPAGGFKVVQCSKAKSTYAGVHSVKAIVNSDDNQSETDKSNNALKSRLVVKD